MEQPKPTKAKAAAVPKTQAQVAAVGQAQAKGPDMAQALKEAMSGLLKPLERMERMLQNQSKGRPGGRRPFRENPSPEQPCNLCGSPEHWATSCPRKGGNQNYKVNQKGGNDKGLDQRSGAQSQK